MVSWSEVSSPVSPSQKARKTDPETSRRAALEAFPRAGKQRHRILLAIAHSSDGLTYDDVSSETGIRGVSASTRISELHQGGWIEPIDERLTSAGSKAIVWKETDKARDSLRKPDQSRGVPLGETHASHHEPLAGRSGSRNEFASQGSPSVAGVDRTGSADLELPPPADPVQLSLVAEPAKPEWA